MNTYANLHQIKDQLGTNHYVVVPTTGNTEINTLSDEKTAVVVYNPSFNKSVQNILADNATKYEATKYNSDEVLFDLPYSSLKKKYSKVFSLHVAVHLTDKGSEGYTSKYMCVNISVLLKELHSGKYYVIHKSSIESSDYFPDYSTKSDNVSRYTLSRIARNYSQLVERESASIGSAALKQAELLFDTTVRAHIERDNYKAKARNPGLMLPTIAPLEVKELKIPENLSIKDKYTYILNQVNEVQASINSNARLAENSELLTAFAETKSKLTAVADSLTTEQFIKEQITPTPEKKPWYKTLFGDSSEKERAKTMADMDVQEAIDVFFGRMYEEHDNVVQICEQIRVSTAELESHKTAMEQLEVECISYIESTYNVSMDDADIHQYVPLAELTLKVTISKQIARLTQAIQNSTVGLVAVSQNTLQLGTELPEIQYNLSTDSSQNILFSKLAKFQDMRADLRQLATSISKKTSDNVYTTVETLMDTAIEASKDIEAITHKDTANTKLVAMAKAKTVTLTENISKTGDYLKSRENLALGSGTASATVMIEGTVKKAEKEEAIPLELSDMDEDAIEVTVEEDSSK